MRRKTLSALLAGFAATAMFASSGAAAGTVMYDAVPDPLPSNVASLGYAALSTSEFGQVITPATTGPLDSVTLTMSSWACENGAGWETGNCATTRTGDGSLPTFDHDITINLYEPGTGVVGDGPGAPIGSVTQTIAVPFRPSVDAACPATSAAHPTGYYADDLGRCTDGYAFNATFDFTSAGITLPSQFVVGIAYNTQNHGAAPIGAPGPYNSLNVGVDINAATEPAVGTPGDNYWDSTYLGRAAGFTSVGDWNYDVMIRFETAPSAPTTADDCKNGGFELYGFTNQGQCVASVKANENAGK